MADTNTHARRNRIAEQKGVLRAEISGVANKVPEWVNSGSIQDTQRWVEFNERAQRVAAGGLARLSKANLQRLSLGLKGELA